MSIVPSSVASFYLYLSSTCRSPPPSPPRTFPSVSPHLPLPHLPSHLPPPTSFLSLPPSSPPFLLYTRPNSPTHSPLSTVPVRQLPFSLENARMPLTHLHPAQLGPRTSPMSDLLTHPPPHHLPAPSPLLHSARGPNSALTLPFPSPSSRPSPTSREEPPPDCPPQTSILPPRCAPRQIC